MRLVRVEVKFERRDAWVGLFWTVKQCTDYGQVARFVNLPSGDRIDWKTYPQHLHLYFCFVPFVVLHIELDHAT